MYQVQDVAEEVRDARDDLAYSADELEEIESRLDVIHKLRRKYGATCEDILQYLEKAKQDAKIHILPIGAISIGQEGKVPADIKGMAEAGAVAFSEDGKSVMNSALYAEGLKLAAEAGVPVFNIDTRVYDKEYVAFSILSDNYNNS